MAFLDEVEAAVPALRRLARGLTGDWDRADDLVQDCLERAIRKRGLFRPTGAVQGWLYRILVNLWRNRLRTDRRRGVVVALDAPGLALSTPATQPGWMALRDLAGAIDRLPPEQREALLLVVLEGLSYAETARVLDIPEGTVVSRISRARATLRVETGEGEPRLRSIP